MTGNFDFSTNDKIRAFQKTLEDSNRWREPLPNLKWITESEFARSKFFMYTGGTAFTRSFGPANKDQLPPEWNDNGGTSYAKCFLMEKMNGFVMLAQSSHVQRDAPVTWNRSGVAPTWFGRIWYGAFAFCLHEHVDSRSLGRCYTGYNCKDCGLSWSIDSSD